MANQKSSTQEQTKTAPHTPGPWRLVPIGQLRRSIRGADNKRVEILSLSTTDANAALMVAAPELADALFGWIEYLDSETSEDDSATEAKLLQAARDALRKAGRQ